LNCGVLSYVREGLTISTSSSSSHQNTRLHEGALGVGLHHEQVSWISIPGARICLAGAWLIRRARIADDRLASRYTAATNVGATRRISSA
jgi:hypothetical protein